jgi:two-component system phosphate regulon sensor histidine kinase PhoR
MRHKNYKYILIIASAVSILSAVALFLYSFALFLVALPCIAAVGWLIFYSLQVAAGIKMLCRKQFSISKIPGPLRQLARAIENITNDCRRTDSKRQDEDLLLQVQLLQRQKNNAEAVIHGIGDCVIVTDPFGKLVTANGAAEKLFDFTFDAGGCEPVERLIDNSELLEMLTKSRQAELACTKHQITLQTRESRKVFDCIISCVKDTRHQVCGVVAVLHDITKEREISQAKNDFVSHVSHELKTPLASINAYAEMLIDGEAKDEQTLKQFCTVIQTQADRLNRLIEDILNISRIESGLTKVSKEQISLAMLIKDNIEMIESYAQEKNITVNARTPIIFDQVLADRDMISQVIVNLLSNAVKYTAQDGMVTIETSVNDTDKTVSFTVTDTGPGIPADEVDFVFDKFYRVKTNEKYAKGTGLGLNLVKQIVEKVHNGRVFVTSTQGQGSTFGFELPLASAAAGVV